MIHPIPSNAPVHFAGNKIQPITNSPMNNSSSSTGSVRLPLGSAKATLEALEAKDRNDTAILRAVTRKFPDAEIKSLEDGRRVFVSSCVSKCKCKLKFIMSIEKKFYLRGLFTIKVLGVIDPVEVWSEQSTFVDNAHMLKILNESMIKLNTELSPF